MENYRRIKKIGTGNYGSIYLVQRKTDDKKFAMKKISFFSLEESQKLSLESKILCTLNHPNIISFEEAFEENGKLVIVMEYAGKGDLHTEVFTKKAKGESMKEYQIMQWIREIVSALEYLHSQKIIHRDLKLQNIMLDTNNTAKIGDFGIAKQLFITNEMAKSWVGTPYYMSPEICASSLYSYSSDIWMLGCCLYELVELQKPFNGNSLTAVILAILNEKPREMRNACCEVVKEIVVRCLDKNPDNRPSITWIKGKIEEYFRDYRILEDFHVLKSSSSISTAENLSFESKKMPNSIFNFIEKVKGHISPTANKHSRVKTADRRGKDSNTLIPIAKSLNSIRNPSSHKRKIFSMKTCIEEGLTMKSCFSHIHNSPGSSQRRELLSEFLRKKLGDELFTRIKAVVDQHGQSNLKEAKEELMKMLGAKNKEYIRMFKYLSAPVLV